jgi:ribosomal-protein-alanine N-acetyltransferase
VEAGEVLAYSIAWFAADEANLANLAVAPAHRRRGCGRALLDDLLAEARRRGAVSVWLEVRAGNAAAQRLYLDHGFRVVAVRKAYYRKEGEDALVMMKDLTAGDGPRTGDEGGLPC